MCSGKEGNVLYHVNAMDLPWDGRSQVSNTSADLVSPIDDIAGTWPGHLVSKEGCIRRPLGPCLRMVFFVFCFFLLQKQRLPPVKDTHQNLNVTSGVSPPGPGQGEERWIGTAGGWGWW